MKTKTMKVSIRGIALAILGLLAGAQAGAQEYPVRAIALVVPNAAGSATDAVARVIAQRLAERLKQPVVIENKAGASTQIAAEHVVKAKPDGYTLFMTTNTSHSANPSLFKSLRYDPIKDFTPIVRTGAIPFVVVVNNSVPAKNLKELIDYARANPGKLSYATPNSSSLIAAETIRVRAKIDIVGVQYKSSPQALTDLVGGQLEMYVIDFVSALAPIKSGKVRPLAVTSARRSALLPDVPPIADTLPGVDVVSWNGIFGPANLPPRVVDVISTQVQAILTEKDTQDRLANIGFEVLPSKSSAEFGRFVADQLGYWAVLVKQAGIQPE